ncbi:hypothetical protein B0H17DRAFT_1128804 [Mycena rosella]|uniref:Uncharacterized protein n=1 Tax=Mycena rosella TaxID=1033263 RepID=A0AAD7DW64_MYCRO|nr:hypothetical protein B0H17DRAFT_1128804 [Mycena rosella]
MLLLFLFVQVFFRISTATQTLNLRAPVDSCDDINSCRKLFDITWGCLTTIFACTWLSMHPNVPPSDQRRLAHLWRRLRMMLIAAIAPELIVGFAARQFFMAWRFSKKFDSSISHGFFFSMGGFVSHLRRPVATIKQLEDPHLGSEYLSAICKVKAADITDKSKGDALSKAVALTQGLWFTTQCLARVHQHLPVTELEVATLAFAVVNVFVWLLWWEKPMNVEQPIPVGPAEEEQQVEPLAPPLNLAGRLLGAVTGGYSDQGYDPISSTAVPTFWSAEHRYQENDYFYNIAVLSEYLAGTIFGALHCAAWNADFPSAVEMWMWRYCSSFVTAFPAVVASLTALWVVVLAAGSVRVEKSLQIIGVNLYRLGVPIYLISRLFLMALPFTTLRALPPGAFIGVDWSVYVPHI